MSYWNFNATWQLVPHNDNIDGANQFQFCYANHEEFLVSRNYTGIHIL